MIPSSCTCPRPISCHRQRTDTDACTINRSGLESSKVEIEVFARRFFFSYKVIKKTESKESLADLLEHAETRMSCSFLSLLFPKILIGPGMTAIELELLEEGQAAGRLLFKISRSVGGGAAVEIPPAPIDSPSSVPPLSIPGSPKQVV